MAPKKQKQPTTNAFVISQYFGFDAFNLPNVTPDHRKKTEGMRKKSEYIDSHMPPVEEHVALLQHVHESDYKLGQQPLMLYSEGQTKGGHKKKRRTEETVSLNIIGSPKSISEAILLKTIQSILKEEGYKDITIQVNSVGAKESQQAFMREANEYYRKHINTMNSACRQAFKDGVHSLVTCGSELPEDVAMEAPISMSHLTDEDRKHFKEVVEYLESQNIPYEVNKDLLGDPHYSTHTVFSIIDNKTGNILATGSRMDLLAKKIGHRKGMPGAHATLLLPKPKKAQSVSPTLNDAQFYFIQIGEDAKRESLHIIDMLREANIPVYQSLSRDRLSTQLEVATRKKFDHVIILGQKEAREGTAVIRNMNKHSQVVVPVKDLVKTLKKIK